MCSCVCWEFTFYCFSFLVAINHNLKAFEGRLNIASASTAFNENFHPRDINLFYVVSKLKKKCWLAISFWVFERKFDGKSLLRLMREKIEKWWGFQVYIKKWDFTLKFGHFVWPLKLYYSHPKTSFQLNHDIQHLRRA